MRVRRLTSPSHLMKRLRVRLHPDLQFFFAVSISPKLTYLYQKFNFIAIFGWFQHMERGIIRRKGKRVFFRSIINIEGKDRHRRPSGGKWKRVLTRCGYIRTGDV